MRTVASSRILTRNASKNTTGYSGRLCHAVTWATIASVTTLIRSGDCPLPSALRPPPSALPYHPAPLPADVLLMCPVGSANLRIMSRMRRL